MIELAGALLSSHTFRIVSLGTVTIGAVSGVLGCFAYLQHQSLSGSVVAHSSLSGIMLGFLLSYLVTGSGSTDVSVLLPGAFVTGLGSMFIARAIVRNTALRMDTAMAVSMSFFFGAGFFLLRIINVRQLPGRSGLEEFLFGQAALITWRDFYAVLILAGLSVGIAILFWKEFKTVVFDRSFAGSVGFPTSFLESLLLVAVVLTIVLGLKSVGVVLMVALLVAPAAAARQFTKRLSRMALLAAVFGALSGLGGAVASAMYTGVPTGPVIVLIAGTIAIVSVLLAPRRGLIARYLQRRANRKRFGKLGKSGSSQELGQEGVS